MAKQQPSDYEYGSNYKGKKGRKKNDIKSNLGRLEIERLNQEALNAENEQENSQKE